MGPGKTYHSRNHRYICVVFISYLSIIDEEEKIMYLFFLITHFLSHNSHGRRMLSFSFSLFVNQAVLILVTKSPTFCFVDFFLSKYTTSSSPVQSDKGCSSCHLSL